MITVAVCAMGKRPFDTIAGRWIRTLRSSGFRVRDHRATVVDRSAVVADLSGGADLVLYLGHGRMRGWNGYQTIRLEHLAESPPRGRVRAVIAFACESAAPDGADDGFGESLVAEGRTVVYVGWAGQLPVQAGLGVANAFVDALARCRAQGSVRQLLDEVADAATDPAQIAVVRDATIIGDGSLCLCDDAAATAV